MAAIRRHWKLVILNLLLLCLSVGSLVWYMSRRPSPAAAVQTTASSPPPAPVALDLNTYGHLQILRNRLCLTDRDLAAMGCSQTQAAAILTSLLNWDQANQTSWDQAMQNQQTAQGSLQAAWRQINVGTQDASVVAQLPNQQSALSSAISSRQQIEQAAATQVANQLTQAQLAIWQTAQANASAPEIYRYVPNLSSAQLSQINLASRQGQDTSSVISVSQQSAMATAGSNQQQSTDAVLAADAAVMPRPANLNVAFGN